MRARQKKRNYRTFFAITLAMAVLIVICESKIRPYIRNKAYAGTKALAARVISETVYEVLNNNDYSDFAVIMYNEYGEVTSIQTLSGKLASVQSQLSCEIFKKLSELSEDEIEISIGDVSGFYLFFKRGIDMKAKIESIGSVRCDAASEFSQSGVNQTCHSIYFDISVDICVVFPFDSVECTVSSRYLAAQTVIVGAVPETFADIR